MVLIPGWLACGPAMALAQSAAPSPAKTVSGLVYGFGAIGAWEGKATLHFGGGGETLIADAVGIGAEIGYLTFFEAIGDGIGVLSFDGAYHFYPHQPSRKARPFVTGGYTLGFREGSESMWNFGGGVDYWLKPTFGLRVEFRDHVWTSEHIWGVRVGVIFR